MSMTGNSMRVELEGDRILVFRAGHAEPSLVQSAAPDQRPFIHPIVAPDGRGILTEDAPAHHPWQHGLFVGMNDVNGAGFWLEGLREAQRAADGTFHPRPLASPKADGAGARWSVETEWRAPGGAPLLDETQAWRLVDERATLALDMEWTLRARTDLRFGEYAYGGLFLRMPYRREWGGEALNSESQDATGAEGQRARWVAVSMPVEGRPDAAGLAILDHPSNPDHPVPWRVDSQLGICPSRSIAGAWQLAAGEATSSRYRVLAFTGPIQEPWVESQWQAFAATPTATA